MQEKANFQVIYWILFNFFISFTFAMVDIVVIYSIFWSIIFSIKRKIVCVKLKNENAHRQQEVHRTEEEKKGTHIVNSERVKDFSFNGFCFFDWKQTNKKIKRKKFYSDFNRNVFKWFFCVWINSIYFRFNRKLVKIPKIFWVEIYTDCAHSSIHSLWKSMEDTLVKYIGVYFKLKRIWCFYLSGYQVAHRISY